MLKNHHSQNRSFPQTQTPSMSPTHSYTLDDAGGNSSHPTSMSSTEPEEDDDICPVCESECTCANRSSRNTGTLPSYIYPNGYVPQDVSKKISGNAPPTSRLPSLKIKLTLPPRPQQANTPGGSKRANPRPSSSKKKFRSLAKAAFAVGCVDTEAPTPSQSLASSRAHDPHVNTDGSVQKKRGRPTKAVAAAREVAKSTLEAKQPNVGTRQSIGNVVAARPSKPSISRTTHLKTSSDAKKKGKKLHGAAAASRARAQQRKAQKKPQPSGSRRQTLIENDESSELSELDDDDEMDDLHSFGLPTFVTAFTSSSNYSSSDSGSETDSDCDKGIPPFPRPQDTPSPYYFDDTAQRRRVHQNKWEIRVRKRSVGPDGTSDVGMDTDSGAEEEEEEEDNDEDENDNDEDADNSSMQQYIRYSGIATGWTDDEESSFDADLFFANLNESTDESDDMGDAEEGFGDEDVEMNPTSSGLNAAGLDVMRLSEVAAAGFLAPFADLGQDVAEHMPFGQGWDNLSLSGNFRDILDLDVHSPRGLPLGSSLELPIPGYEDADAVMATSEEEEAVAMFDNCSPDADEEDGVEIFEDSDDGETTEDEFIDVDGIATPRRHVLLRFPASLGAINPMSTVSSPIRGPIGRERASSTISLRSRSRPVPKPSDILSGNVYSQEDKEDVSHTDSSTGAATPAPTMGSFASQASDKTQRVIISSSAKASGKILPCPYPAVRRLRGRGTSISMMSRSGSDRSRRSCTPSLLSATRSPFEAFGSGDFDITDDVQLPLGEPIQLDDVIDTKFLEPERSDATLPESTTYETGEAVETYKSESERDRHLENLRRWDRIPIDAFRRTRAATTTNDFVEKIHVIGTPRAPRPADGFSYGSSVSGVLRGSPLNTTLWEVGSAGARLEPNSNAASENIRGKLLSLLGSPVLLPARDGDRTPTAERQQQHQQQQNAHLGFGAQRAAYKSQNIKSRKELRKEKKRNRKFFGSAPSHIRQNHFPNSKSRSSSSMQRSSIPSLSL